MLPLRHQRGAILIMTAIVLIVLVGVAALAMDIGRLVVLRSQLQNAADAAAIAAAVELDGEADARERAMAAAREAVRHDKSFAKLRDLLGTDSLPDAAFSFYCMIGAEFDLPQDVAISGGFCQGVAEGAVHVTAGGDPDAHYVRVSLDPSLAAGRFTLDLIFLPILNLITPGVATEASVSAQAVAGRHFTQCNYPPMAICDPFEGTAKSFRDDMPMGTTIRLRDQGAGNGNWSPGNAGFLTPISGATGANAVADALANPDDQGCATRLVTTEPGQMTQKTTSAINTRFDMYDSHFRANQWTSWKPAPNIYEYQDVDSPVAVPGLDVNRFSMPDWKYADWVTAQEAAYGPLTTAPPEWAANKPLRWDVYNWEIANNRILVQPIAAHRPAGPPERRVFAVAVLSCNALSVKGRVDVLVNNPDGFAKVFIYKQATPPSGATIFGEYVGWYGEGDANYHVETQLYE